MPPAPINIYISHAPEDRDVLQKLLRWLRPLEQQYFLRIWYNVPVPPPDPIPLSWRILLFWYTPPPRYAFPWHPQITERVAQAHIFLFLTSYKSISTPWIEQREIVPAVQRFSRLGPGRVRIFPVIVSPSRWEESSRLGAFRPLGPPRPLSTYDPDDEAFLVLVRQLEKVIQDIQRNQTERQHLLARPAQPEAPHAVPDDTFLPELDEFSRTNPVEAPAQEWPLPGWLGSTIILIILWLTYLGIEPYVRYRFSTPYRPLQAEPVIEIPPDELVRENELYPPPFDRPLYDTTEYPPIDTLPRVEPEGIDPDGIED
jgi:hypothetical protein